MNVVVPQREKTLPAERNGKKRPRRLGSDRLLAVSFVSALLLLLVAIFGRFLAPYPPDQVDILATGQWPGVAHLLGTDSLGRDILSRALYGASLSFAGPGIVVLGSGFLGTAIAIYAAWNGGWVDALIAKALNVMFAVPGILVAVLASAIFGAGFWAPVIALTIIYIPYIARVVRSAAVREIRQPYVEGLKLAGISSWNISLRHILRNVAPILLAQVTISFGSALIDFAAVSFLGLGVQPPQAEWGAMIADGRSELLEGAYMQTLVAGLCIVVTVVTFSVLGDRISARLGLEK